MSVYAALENRVSCEAAIVPHSTTLVVDDDFCQFPSALHPNIVHQLTRRRTRKEEFNILTLPSRFSKFPKCFNIMTEERVRNHSVLPHLFLWCQALELLTTRDQRSTSNITVIVQILYKRWPVMIIVVDHPSYHHIPPSQMPSSIALICNAMWVEWNRHIASQAYTIVQEHPIHYTYTLHSSLLQRSHPRLAQCCVR